MWIRNLGFMVLCIAGLGVLGSRLLPHQLEMPAVPLDREAHHGTQFLESLQTLNGAFEAHWQSNGVHPSAQADPWLVYRRLGLALTGTIPSLEEIRQLERIPPSDRLAWWIDRLLSDRRYSDYWAERFARAYVGIEDGPFLVYRRRRFVTWLSDQFQANRPYDDLVRELISGKGLWTDSPAVNFITVTNDVNGDEQPDEERLAARTARAFLGIRLDCVQCHDDNLGGNWRQADFQQLAAFFAPAQSSLLGIHDKQRNYEFQYLHATEKEVVPPKAPFNSQLLPPEIPIADARQQLAQWVTHPENEAFSRAMVNRVWALMFGRPLHNPIDNLPLAAPFAPGLDELAKDFAKHGYDLKRLVRLIGSSRPFQLSSATEATDDASENFAWNYFPLTRLRPEQMASSILQASSLRTIDANSHILVRLAQNDQQKDFVNRYGDKGEDEFHDRPGTIPQQLLIMNGNMVRERTKDDLLANAITRIAALAPEPERALEVAYLTALTRTPSDEERNYFLPTLRENKSERRNQMEDIYWTLLNSLEFSWNH